MLKIGEFTGYRYYREEQLFIIGRITSLRDMGFVSRWNSRITILLM